jgi:hypothetical protein
VRLVEVDGHSAALLRYGEGLEGITVIETAAKGGEPANEGSSPGGEPANQDAPALPLQLPTRKIDGVSATEIPTELGTALSFSSGGVEHILFGSVTASTIEAAARGL